MSANQSTPSDDVRERALACASAYARDETGRCLSAFVEDAIRAAVAAERERCAAIADTSPLACDEEWTLEQVAMKIREVPK